jgi:hypothetical protein
MMKKTLLLGLSLAAMVACKNDETKTPDAATAPPPIETNAKIPEVNTTKIDLNKVQQGIESGKAVKAALNDLSAELNKLPASVKKQRQAEFNETRDMINALLDKSSHALDEIRVVELLKKMDATADGGSRSVDGLQRQENLPLDAANPEEASLIKGVQESKQAIYLLDENIKSLNELQPVIEELKAKVAKLKQ